MILAELAASGLGLLAKAATNMGLTWFKNWTKEKTGIELDEAKPLSPEVVERLKIAEMQHEEELQRLALERDKVALEATRVVTAVDTTAAQEITKRWEADDKADSWLAKNIRPLALIYILTTYTVFSLMSAWGVEVKQAYVELLGQWGQLIMGAYFLGRTFEKAIPYFKGGAK